MNNRLKRLGAQVGVFVFILVVISLMAGVGYRIGVSQIWGRIIISIAILGLGWLIISVCHRLMERTIWKFVAFLILYSLSIWVYSRVSSTVCDMVNVLAPINNTLSLFFPSRGSYNELANLQENMAFQYVHLLSYLFFAMIVFSWFGRRLINRAGYTLIFPSHKNVFWGYSEGGVLLAKDILKNTSWQQVIFVLPDSIKIDEEGEKRVFELLDGIGAIVLYKNLDLIKRFPKAHRHFFLTEDQDLNTRMALTVSKATKKTGVSIYLRTDTPQVWTLFEESKNELHLFNQPDLTARKFTKDYPMIACAPQESVSDLKVKYNFKLLIVGFGQTGQEVLHKEICDSQFVDSRFSATIFDTSFYTKNGAYAVLMKECMDEYDLNFNPGFTQSSDPNIIRSVQFYEWVENHISDYDRVIIALGDDRLNLDVAITFSQIAQYKCKVKKQNLIFAHIRQPERYSYCKRRDYPVTLFGDMREIYTMDMIINEKIDLAAKAINYVYGCWEKDMVEQLEIEQNAEREWRNTVNLFHKDSSRAAAANIDNILRLTVASKIELSNAIADHAYLETLATMEHLRWNAFHLTQGVRKCDVDAITTEYDDAKLFSTPGNKSSILLKHGCITGYSLLKAVSDRVNENRKQKGKEGNEDFQETDRRIVRHYPIINRITKLQS